MSPLIQLKSKDRTFYLTVIKHYLKFLLKIQRMETKLNICLSRDLALMGRTLLAKMLGISQLLYTASMLTVPQEVIKRIPKRNFNFFGKLGEVLCFQEMRKSGLNFPFFYSNS